jgi:hypothetical protein
MNLEQLCEAGEAADAHLEAGRLDEAEKAYAGLLNEMIDEGEIQPFVLAKLTLGLLITTLQQGNIPTAHQIWTASEEDDPFALAIHSLENAETDDHDFIVYLFIAAFLHSLGTEPAEAEAAVNDYMARVCQYAASENPEMLPMAVNNWRQHLVEVYEDQEIPPEALEQVEAAGAGLDGADGTDPIGFPLPSPWTIEPDDEEDEWAIEEEGEEGDEAEEAEEGDEDDSAEDQ